MKKIKSLIALLLTLMMVFALAACTGSGDSDDKGKKDDGGKTDDVVNTESVVGAWEAEIDLGSEVAAAYSGDDEMSQLMKNIDFSNIYYKMRLEFNDDGSYSMQYLEDGALAKLRAALKEGFVPIMEKICADEGTTVEAVAASMDISVDEYYDQLVEVCMASVEPIFGQSTKGQYEVKDGRIYTFAEGEELDEDSYFEYTLDGNKLTLSENIDGEAVNTLVFDRV